MSAPRVELPESALLEPTHGQVPSAPRTGTYTCDHCHRTFDGPPAGSGLLIWTRGDEVRYEEPPLCDDCALSVTAAAMMSWSLDGDDEE